jgi:hypothetical protein
MLEKVIKIQQPFPKKSGNYQNCSVSPPQHNIYCVVLNPQHLKSIDLPKKKN